MSVITTATHGNLDIAEATSEYETILFGEFLHGDWAPRYKQDTKVETLNVSLTTRSTVALDPCNHSSNLGLNADIQLRSLSKWRPLRPKLVVTFLPDDQSVTVETLLTEAQKYPELCLVIGFPVNSNVTDNYSEIVRLKTLIQTGVRLSSGKFIRAGAIGPVDLTDSKATDIALKAAEQFGPKPAPVCFYVPWNSSEDESKQFQRVKEAVKTKLVPINGTSTVLLNPLPLGTPQTASLMTDIMELIELLTERHIGVVQNIGSCRDASGVWPGRSLTASVNDLRRDLKPLMSKMNLIMSSGLFFKTDCEQYGGEGYCSRLERLVTKGIFDIPLATMRSLQFLAFNWTPPESVAVEQGQFQCDKCKGFFPLVDSDSAFHKFGFTYCSVACLSKHRKEGFK